MSVSKDLFRKHVYASTDNLSRRIIWIGDMVTDSDIPLDEKDLILNELKAMSNDILAIHTAFHDFNM